jgi:lipid II:glycine glycyltransferase (peptidoglycan interpeptide bridge formation enzyme)
MRMAHRPRREYVLDLAGEDPFRSMRKGHTYEIKRAGKAGLRIRRTRNSDACKWHVRLIDASLRRRTLRGEVVDPVKAGTSYHALLAAGAADLFQAVKDGNVIASNMVLLAPHAGYNHSQGASLEGMACGAAHFLVHEIAWALRVEGRTIFNLGGADQAEGGLERFKTGFSANTVRVDLETADYACSNDVRVVVPFVGRWLRRRWRADRC